MIPYALVNVFNRNVQFRLFERTLLPDECGRLCYPKMTREHHLYVCVNGVDPCQKIGHCLFQDIYFIKLVGSEKTGLLCSTVFPSLSKTKFSRVYTGWISFLNKRIVSQDIEHVGRGIMETKINKYMFVAKGWCAYLVRQYMKKVKQDWTRECVYL